MVNICSMTLIMSYSLSSPVVTKPPRRDIVFLLDGSDGTRNGFPAMRDFVEKVVEKLNVGQNKDRFSVVQYSREAEVDTEEDDPSTLGQPSNTSGKMSLQTPRGAGSCKVFRRS